jgi:hypothetical protein
VSAARAAASADAALALVQPAAEARGRSISANCLGVADAMYEGDEDRVRQILVNLLNNAVKFTEPGGQVTLSCGVTSRPDADARLIGDSWVFLRVRDTGIGIPSNQITTIFDPFVQVEGGHTRPNDGSGLGLTISRRLARLMHGDLTVRSEVGKGSVFTVWLPEAASASGQTPPPAAESAPTASRLQGLAEIGEAMVRELEPTLSAFVARLRSDSVAPSAVSLRFSQLADHVGTFLANVGSVLIAVEESRGQPSGLVADGAEIQRLIAERHGMQRARLGWTVDALRHEWSLLLEEVERGVRRRVHNVDESTLREAIAIIRRFVDQGEQLSCRMLTRALQDGEARQSRAAG